MQRGYLFAILGFLGMLLFFKFAFLYLAPFLIAAILALILDPLLYRLEKLGLPRPPAAMILVTFTFCGLPFLAAIFLVQLWSEVQALGGIAVLGELSNIFSEKIILFLEAFPLFELQFSAEKLVNFGEILLRWALAIPDLLLIWLVAAVSAYFFCKDKRAISSLIQRNLPARWRRKFFLLYSQTYSAVWRLIRLQLALVSISTCLSVLLFYSLNLPYALLLGLAAGFLDLVPILGPGIVYLVMIAYYLFLGRIWLAWALGIAYLVFILLRQLGEPHLIGQGLGLHPLLALIALYVGFKVWGLLGAMLGPILMVFLKTALAAEHK
ncbi:MAG: AI-2E family transporter [Firmicutes bacterium]|nr:AI-2E family transporter [Bacillota bacterium]